MSPRKKSTTTSDPRPRETLMPKDASEPDQAALEGAAAAARRRAAAAEVSGPTEAAEQAEEE